MKIERTKNTVRNILTGSVNRVINIILPFFTRTVILYVMGTKYLGLSSLFTSILSFLSLSELGLGAAMVYSMYKPIAQNDEKTICALLNLYRRLYRIIGLVVLTLGLALMPFLRQLINDEIPADMNLHLLYLIYLFNSVLSYWLFAYMNALLQAHQRNDINNVISSVIVPVSYAVMLGSLWLTKNYYAYIIWQPIFTVITNLIRSRYVDKHFPELKPRGEISPELRHSITKKVAALIGTKLNTVVLNAADNLVMSAFLGLTVIAVYGNYYMIMSSIIGFLGIVYSAMTAGLGNSLQTESLEKNYADFEKLSFMNAWLVGWCTVCLVCLYQPFMKLWTGEELMFPMYVVLNITLVQVIGISGIILSTVFSLFISIPWENYTIFKYVFDCSGRSMPERCLYCVDKLNALADISLGDNYTKIATSKLGSNSVILRTGRGMEAWNACLESLEAVPVEMEQIHEAQYLLGRLNNLYFGELKSAGQDLNAGVPREQASAKFERAWKTELRRLRSGACYDRDPVVLEKQMARDARKPNPIISFLRRGLGFVKRRLWSR